MTDRTARIAELQKQRQAIDTELAGLKKQMRDEIKAAFTVPKNPRRKKETANA
jgi:hypothetical protein